jgi:hypothetical protein
MSTAARELLQRADRARREDRLADARADFTVSRRGLVRTARTVVLLPKRFERTQPQDSVNHGSASPPVNRTDRQTSRGTRGTLPHDALIAITGPKTSHQVVPIHS